MRKEFSEPLCLSDPEFEPERLIHCALSTQSGRLQTLSSSPKVGIRDFARILFAAIPCCVLNYNENWAICWLIHNEI
jgi:hypothetical protein